jgi:CelD/BcsL family acetyltransferase involved in cellulose biosynthesis
MTRPGHDLNFVNLEPKHPESFRQFRPNLGYKLPMDRGALASQQGSVHLGGNLSQVSDLGGLASLRGAWTALESRCHSAPTVFQSFDWVHEWSKIYCDPNTANAAEIRIITGRRDNQLVFVLPLMLRRIQGLKMLTLLSEPHAQYGDILCHRDENPELWMTAALEFCQAKSTADILYIRHVRDDSILATFAKRHLADGHFNEKAPYLDLSVFGSSAEYDSRYSSTQKKRRKKIRKYLQELGPVNFTAVSDPAASDAAIASAVTEKEIWLKKRGRYSRVLNCPRHVDFLRGLARLRDSSIKLVVTKLSAGDKTASWDISFRYEGTNYCYITSHVNTLNDLSPGRLHMDQSQRLSLADGIKKFDLMVPNDPHKESWCSGKMDVNDYYFAFSAKGRLYGAAYLGWFRPLLRKAYYMLPQRALVAIQPFTG